MTQPLVFLSCVSPEFGQTRSRVGAILTRLGYTPVIYKIFGTEPGDLRQVLSDKIDACEGLIQIVGHGYGPEPPTVDANYSRVSYTQFELLYARALKKKTWLIFAGDTCTRDTPLDGLDLPLPIDPAHPDPASYKAERHALQLAYRDKRRNDGHLYYDATGDTDLDLKVERLRDELAKLHQAFNLWQNKLLRAFAVVFVLLGSVWWFGYSHLLEAPTPTPIPKAEERPIPEVRVTPLVIPTPEERTAPEVAGTPLAIPTPAATPEERPTLFSRKNDTLPAFFPPKATSTADLQPVLKVIWDGFYAGQGRGPSMRQLDWFLKGVLELDGYNNLSHYWLEGESNPGFALVSRIELIDDVGMPVRNHRFDMEIPPLSWFRGWEFLKALAFPQNGRYRLIALVVSQNPLVEKKSEMTRAEMEEINHGPSGLSDRDWADMEVTPDYFFVVYVYEFYRKTRSDPISFQESSDIQAQKHLTSVNFSQNVGHELKNIFPFFHQ
jgi:hypothetical protein